MGTSRERRVSARSTADDTSESTADDSSISVTGRLAQLEADYKDSSDQIAHILTASREDTRTLKERLTAMEKNNEELKLKWTEKRVEADPMFLRASPAEATFSNFMDKNATALTTLADMRKNYEAMKESLAQFQKANSVIIFGINEETNPEADAKKAIRSAFMWTIPEYTRFTRRGQRNGDRPRPVIMTMTTPNQAIFSIGSVQ